MQRKVSTEEVSFINILNTKIKIVFLDLFLYRKSKYTPILKFQVEFLCLVYSYKGNFLCTEEPKPVVMATQ